MDKALESLPSTTRTLGFSWPLLVALFAFVGLLGSKRSNALLNDADTYWHLATGRWIVAHGAVPATDPFSHSMPGAVWTAHEWLSELVMLAAHTAAGWAGLVALAALAFAGTLAYLMRFLLRRMEPAHALLFTALAAGMMFGHLLARPHVLAWPLLAVWVGTLIDASEQQRRPRWWLLPMMALWANLHGSFTLGLAFGAALALDAVLAVPPAARRATAGSWAVFLGLAVFAAMLTPSGWHGLAYTAQVMSMTLTLDVVGEWRSPDFHRLQVLEVWLALVLGIACMGRMRLPWLRLVLVLGLLHLALKQQRQIAVLGLLSPMLMAAPLAAQWKATEGGGRDAEAIDRVFRALAAPARAGAMAVCAVVMALIVAMVVRSGRVEPAESRTPKAAVSAAMRAGASGAVLNAYNFGGYLIYTGVPVFVDGRSDMYGDALMQRFVGAMQLEVPDELTRLIAEYRIGWTLLEPGTPALAVLDRMPEWRRVYADAIAVVHVRDLGAAR